MPTELRDEAFFRLGASVLGVFAGVAFALLVFAPLVVLGVLEGPLLRLACAGAVAGIAVGAALPTAAVAAFEGLVHFVAGLLGFLAGEELVSDSPGWLLAAFWVGVLYFGIVWLVLHAYALFTKYPP
jgi:hypothetical protein